MGLTPWRWVHYRGKVAMTQQQKGLSSWIGTFVFVY